MMERAFKSRTQCVIKTGMEMGLIIALLGDRMEMGMEGGREEVKMADMASTMLKVLNLLRTGDG